MLRCASLDVAATSRATCGENADNDDSPRIYFRIVHSSSCYVNLSITAKVSYLTAYLTPDPNDRSAELSFRNSVRSALPLLKFEICALLIRARARAPAPTLHNGTGAASLDDSNKSQGATSCEMLAMRSSSMDHERARARVSTYRCRWCARHRCHLGMAR